jgi:hypothetical protein
MIAINVAIKRYRCIIAIKSRDVTKMTKMIALRNDLDSTYFEIE